jgi:hypothetical protein
MRERFGWLRLVLTFKRKECGAPATDVKDWLAPRSGLRVSLRAVE